MRFLKLGYYLRGQMYNVIRWRVHNNIIIIVVVYMSTHRTHTHTTCCLLDAVCA